MRSQPLQDAELYVIIIIKKPLVAIRYRLSDGQVRFVLFYFHCAKAPILGPKNTDELSSRVRL